ncbi:hypothetical protein BC940DRAFT_337621 [Gongronella butleri]|nr:hypothetical protein BC940DRAFT_337621 [Gongronella butleri]
MLHPTQLLSSESLVAPSVRREGKMYDAATRKYLQDMFLATVWRGLKPTRAQRSQMMLRTGLSSRKLTYWFSNTKRRWKKPSLQQWTRLRFEKKKNGNEIPETQGGGGDTAPNDGSGANPRSRIP